MSCTIVSVYLLRTPFFEINKNKGDCSLETENFNNLEGFNKNKGDLLQYPISFGPGLYPLLLSVFF